MLVKDLMTTSLSTIRPEDPVTAAVEIMRSEDVGFVPVCDIQDHILGVITDRDVLLRDGLSKTSEEIMSSQVYSIAPKADIHQAASLFAEKGVRRLPVVENDKLVGILTLKDLAGKRMMIAEIGHILFEICNRK